MHRPAIHPDVVRRATQRRGGLRVFDRLTPAQTAHVVVDLQNGFMAPGAVAEIAAAREIVPNVNRVSAALRAAGGLVVYVQNTFDDVADQDMVHIFRAFLHAGAACADDRDVQPRRVRARAVAWPRRAAAGPACAEAPLRGFCAGCLGPACNLLQARGIDTLIITGTATQVCCEFTARDAMMLNYKVFFISDGNATFTDEEHNATLSAMAHAFCDVIDTDAMVGNDR